MPGGEVSRNLSDRDDRMGAKIKTPKNPQGFQQNPKKYLDKHLPPPQPAKKNSHAKFPSLLDSNSTRGTQELLLFINNIMENAIFFWKRKKILRKSNHPTSFPGFSPSRP